MSAISTIWPAVAVTIAVIRLSVAVTKMMVMASTDQRSN